MKLIVTIDVEEDNWGEFIPIGYSLENIKKIHGLQKLFDQYDVKPTYLINYPVATDKFSIEMFKSFLAEGKCEIGMHCHPWNTPPFVEEHNAFSSMMSNLPAELQFSKLKVLKETIVNNLGVNPVSYRAGRWAFHEGSAKALEAMGFKVDSSVTAYTDWSEFHGVDYSDLPPAPFKFNSNNIFKSDPYGSLLQVPATVGYLQHDFSRANKLFKSLKGKMSKGLRLKGLFDKFSILNQVSFSPEMETSEKMISLIDVMAKRDLDVLNMFFHSTSLVEGLTPLCGLSEGGNCLIRRLESVLQYSSEKKFSSMTLSEYENSFSGNL
jgi:hypothetical protein